MPGASSSTTTSACTPTTARSRTTSPSPRATRTSARQLIPAGRAYTDPATGTGRTTRRPPINAVSGWLDGSMVYGSSAAVGGEPAGGRRPYADLGRRQPADRQWRLRRRRRAGEGEPVADRAADHLRARAQHAGGPAGGGRPELSRRCAVPAGARHRHRRDQPHHLSEFLPHLLGGGAIAPSGLRRQRSIRASRWSSPAPPIASAIPSSRPRPSGWTSTAR